MPSLVELTALFDVLPEIPPPLPRRRQQNQQQANQNSTSAPPRKPTLKYQSIPLLQRVLSWTKVLSSSSETHSQRKPNPFVAIKAGKKNAVIAVVDAGTPSFFRFGQGAFDMWPMFG
jgi:tRNA-splicing endonuclease subunit Sen54